jgi:hypothetical protein
MLLAGAAALAMWVNVRLPRLAPPSSRGTVTWFAAAVVSPALPRPAISVLGSRNEIAAALTLIVLTNGVCLMLSFACFVRWASGRVEALSR